MGNHEERWGTTKYTKYTKWGLNTSASRSEIFFVSFVYFVVKTSGSGETTNRDGNHEIHQIHEMGAEYERIAV